MATGQTSPSETQATDDRAEPSVADVLRSASAAFADAGLATPVLDARTLLSEALAAPLASVHSYSDGVVDAQAAERFASFIERRLRGEPVHRIIGRRAFYDHEFHLSPGTLEPRPDTETLVEVAKAEIADLLGWTSAPVLADLGIGSGVIAVSLLSLFPAARAVGVDVSDDALSTARRNAEAAGVADRLELKRSDYCAVLSGPFDLVVSNPPYIPSREIAALSVEVREHDPLAALDGGADGLDAYRAIAGGVHRVLRPHGAVIVEIGRGQEADVAAVFASRGFACEAQTRDLSGTVRVLTFRKSAL